MTWTNDKFKSYFILCLGRILLGYDIFEHVLSYWVALDLLLKARMCCIWMRVSPPTRARVRACVRACGGWSRSRWAAAEADPPRSSPGITRAETPSRPGSTAPTQLPVTEPATATTQQRQQQQVRHDRLYITQKEMPKKHTLKMWHSIAMDVYNAVHMARFYGGAQMTSVKPHFIADLADYPVHCALEFVFCSVANHRRAYCAYRWYVTLVLTTAYHMHAKVHISSPIEI